MESQNLTVGDTLTLLNGGRQAITGIASSDTSLTVYNFTVEQAHTYFVSASGVLVHNSSKLAYNHSYQYADRVRSRVLQDPKAHNFSYSFDDEILKTKPFPEVDGSNTYLLKGSMWDGKKMKEGFYILGVNERKNTIFHRSFETEYIPRKK
ncbi:MAG: polymorphic toxin-type HINT domain-containing protein [Candidatus Kapaibacterium sp.]